MNQDISNVQLLLFLAGWVSATSALHHRKTGEDLKFTLMTGLWGGLTVYGRVEMFLAMILIVAAIVV
jgi:hypothetical protein